MAEERTIRIIGKTRESGACKSCQAPVTWAITFPNEKRIPLDGDPVALKTEHHNDHGTIEFVAASSVHFASCPDARAWSNKKTAVAK